MDAIPADMYDNSEEFRHASDQDHQRCYQVREMDMEYRRCGEGVVAGMW
jgi:hypothetical protein